MIDSFIWIADGGEEAVLILARPLEVREPDHFEDRYPEVSLDGSVVEVTSSGTVLMGQVIEVVHEPASALLEELRRVAMNGVEITLTHLADPDRVFAVKAVPGTISRVEREAESGIIGRFRFGMTVRLLSGDLFV